MAGRNVRLIAGGLPKGDNPKNVLSALTNRVKKVYIIGQSAEAFFQAWSSEVNCEICGTMDSAVEAVKREAECGDTVLLSPGTASYDQFKNFEERGDVFARLVKEGTKNE
jgi:UDP-N-acetylmuramoylalanine--D-glutamate ligase